MSTPAPEPGATVRVERALVGLEELDTRPTAEHAPLYAAVHRELSEVLADAGAGTTGHAADAADEVRESDGGEADNHSNG